MTTHGCQIGAEAKVSKSSLKMPPEIQKMRTGLETDLERSATAREAAAVHVAVLAIVRSVPDIGPPAVVVD